MGGRHRYVQGEPGGQLVGRAVGAGPDPDDVAETARAAGPRVRGGCGDVRADGVLLAGVVQVAGDDAAQRRERRHRPSPVTAWAGCGAWTDVGSAAAPSTARPTASATAAASSSASTCRGRVGRGRLPTGAPLPLFLLLGARVELGERVADDLHGFLVGAAEHVDPLLHAGEPLQRVRAGAEGRAEGRVEGGAVQLLVLP